MEFYLESVEDFSFLGKAIKRLRKKLGFSQEEFAEGICDRTFLSKLENGQRKAPSVMLLNKICQKLSVTIDDLFYIAYSDGDDSISMVISDINAYLKIYDYEEANKLAELHLKNLEIPVFKQFYLYVKAAYYWDKKEYKVCEVLVEEAIHLTTSFTGPLLTLTEFRLVNMFLYINFVVNRFNGKVVVMKVFDNFRHYMSVFNCTDYEVVATIYLDWLFYYLVMLKLDAFELLYYRCEENILNLKLFKYLRYLWMYKYLYHMILEQEKEKSIYYSKVSEFSKLLNDNAIDKLNENIHHFTPYIEYYKERKKRGLK